MGHSLQVSGPQGGHQPGAKHSRSGWLWCTRLSQPLSPVTSCCFCSRAPAVHPLALPVFPLPSPAIPGPHHQAPGDVAEGEAQRPPQAHAERGAARARRCPPHCPGRARAMRGLGLAGCAQPWVSLHLSHPFLLPQGLRPHPGGGGGHRGTPRLPLLAGQVSVLLRWPSGGGGGGAAAGPWWPQRHCTSPWMEDTKEGAVKPW